MQYWETRTWAGSMLHTVMTQDLLLVNANGFITAFTSHHSTSFTSQSVSLWAPPTLTKPTVTSIPNDVTAVFQHMDSKHVNSKHNSLQAAHWIGHDDVKCHNIVMAPGFGSITRGYPRYPRTYCAWGRWARITLSLWVARHSWTPISQPHGPVSSV